MWIVGKKQISGHIDIKILFAKARSNSNMKDTARQQQQLADAVYKW